MAKSLVILSGGADSTICAAIAKQRSEVHAITFDYGQRHRIEIESAMLVAQALNLASHEIIECQGILKSISPLTSNNPVEQYDDVSQLPNGIASTFVPIRNLLFLTVAANRAVSLGCETIYTGVCQTDYSGYPDCRRGFINKTEEALFAALEQKLQIATPLMYLTKAESIKLAQQVLGDDFEQVISLTHTCYLGVKGGCGKCAACLLREKGFEEAGIVDPLLAPC